MKGAVDAIAAPRRPRCPPTPGEVAVERIAAEGGTPLAVADERPDPRLIYLKDTVKPGMVERFDELRRMGIRTIMVTGDNR